MSPCGINQQLHSFRRVLSVHFAPEFLKNHNLFATSTTGRLVEEASGLQVHKFLAGHLGGVQQIATQIESNQMDLVIFLRNPMDHITPDNDFLNTTFNDTEPFNAYKKSTLS